MISRTRRRFGSYSPTRRIALGVAARAEAALQQSFNAIIVDGDMSTNDTVLLLANGVAGNRALTPRSPGFAAFAAAVTRLMRHLARLVVKDGEGATKLIDIVVRGARSARDAVRMAEAIARSPLCKTAFFGGDPYAGRIVCAAGYSGAAFDPTRLDVYLGNVQIVRRGVEVVRGVASAPTPRGGRPGVHAHARPARRSRRRCGWPAIHLPCAWLPPGLSTTLSRN
jgi:glutamate N-acetyltransferase/amino-acid N-acetyltransferase